MHGEQYTLAALVKLEMTQDNERLIKCPMLKGSGRENKGAGTHWSAPLMTV